MKNSRILFAAALAVILTLAVVAVGSEHDDSAVIVIKPSTMKDGETKTLIDDGKKITLRRDGENIEVTIEGGGKTDRMVIRKGSSGEIEIDRDGVRRRLRVAGPGSHKLFIDGMPHMMLDKLPGGHSDNWYSCPKDRSLLRVPEGKEDGTYRCPVDGTTMEKQKGRGFGFWFSSENEC